MQKALAPWVRNNFIRLDRYRDEESRQKRIPVLIKMMYSMAYYTLSSIAGYLLVKDTSMMPTWLGGRG